MSDAVRVIDRVQDMTDWNQSGFTDGKVPVWDAAQGKFVAGDAAGVGDEAATRAAADIALSQSISVVSAAVAAETVARVNTDTDLVSAINVVSQGLSVLDQAILAETAARGARDDVLSNAASDALSVANAVS